MWRLIKQCFKAYLKKPWFLITMIISYFVIIFLAAASITTMASISTSYNNTNANGNSAQMAISNFDNIENTKLVPDFDLTKNENYKPKITKTARLNMNGINVDSWSSLSTFEEKYNFLRIFPYKRSDLVPHKTKKNYANNPNNNTVYNDIPGSLMYYSGNPLLDIPLTLINGSYGCSVSFFNPYENKLSFDPRNILFSLDEQNNSFDILGYWDDGVIVNAIRINAELSAFTNSSSSGDTIFNDPNYSPLELNRTNANTMLSNEYIASGGRKYQINDMKGLAHDVLIGNKNAKLMRKRTTYDTVIDDYLTSLPFNSKPSDANVPYIEITNGYEFSFLLPETSDETDKLFKEYLMQKDPNNKLLKPLVLDEFNLLGMSLENYNKLTDKEKEKKNSEIEANIRQYGYNLSSEWNAQKKNWIYQTLTSKLKSQYDIDSSYEYEYYYQSITTKHEYLYVPKKENSINSIVINEGMDLPHELSVDSIKELNLSEDKELTLDDLYQFLTFLKTFSLTNENKKKQFDELIDKCLVDIKNSSSIEAFNRSPNWFEWVLRYGNRFSINNNDAFNYSFNIGENSGFTSLWFSITLSKVNLANFFVVLSESYYYENKKKCLPITGYETVDGVNVYSLEYIVNNPNDFDDTTKLSNYISSVPDQYKVSYFDKEFLIIGSGISPDYSYPIVNIQSPIPEPKTQGIIYTTPDMYASILKYNNTNMSISYIALKSHGKSNSYLVEATKSIMSENFGNENLLSITSPSNINGTSSLRYSLPSLLQSILIIGSIAITIILFIILLYVSYMMLNIVIEKLNSIISICRAEGFSKWKIALCIALPLITLVAIVGGLSYLITFFVTPLILGSLSGIWFLSLASLPFDWYVLLSCIAFPIAFIVIVIFSLIYIKFRRPVMECLNDVDNAKGSRSWLLFRNVSNNSLTIWKYRANLFLSKFSKLFILISLIAMTFGLGLGAFTINQNSQTALYNSNNSKQYTYSIDLVSPRDNIGLYKQIPYTQAGITNTNKNINISDVFFTQNDPYGKLITNQYLVTNASGQQEWVNESQLAGRLALDVKSVPSDVFALRDSNGNIIDYDPTTPEIDAKYFTNYILPSYNTYNLVTSNYTNLLYDSILSIFLIDIDINLGVLNLGNIWQNYVKPHVPQKIAYQMEMNVRSFKRLIYETYPVEFSKFIKSPDNVDLDNIEINSNKVIITDLSDNFSKIRYNDDYLKFLGMVFANPVLAQNDVKLIGGTTIPVNDYDEYIKNNLSSFDETYTWTNSDYFKINNQKVDASMKIFGVKSDSRFVKLYDNSGNKINISNLKNNEIIINNGAALKYNLKIGDQITFYPKNDYFSNALTISNYIKNNMSTTQSSINLFVKDISNDPVGECFYTKQENVNNWINLDDGRFISSIKMNHYEPNFASNIIYEDLSEYIKKNPTYIPFNGIFTNSSIPLIGDKAILLTSTAGFYSCFFTFDSLVDPTTAFIDPTVFSKLYATNNKEILNLLGLSSSEEMSNLIYQNFSTSAAVIEWISSVYNNTLVLTNLSAVGSNSLVNQLFGITNVIIGNTTILLLSVFIPILFSTIIVSIVGIIDLVKKQIGTLRLLGYTSAKITRTVLYLFLPSIILSGFIGIGVLFLILYLAQNQLYNLTSIFIATNPNVWIILFGIGLLFILLLFISIVCYMLLKRLKYSQLIKNTYN